MRRPPADAPAPAPGLTFQEFRSTGLPVLLRFRSTGWKAVETRAVTEPETELIQIGTAEDGANVFVRNGSKEPFETVLVPVLDEEGSYVEYRRQTVGGR